MILMKNIIREGHKTLETVAKDVKLPLSSADKKLLVDLLTYVKNSQDNQMVEKYGLRPAVGIAAPQVNVSKRMFACHVQDFDGTLYSYALVNPVMTKKSLELIYLPGGEGCLSVDRETEGITPRYKSVTFEALHYDQASDQLIPVKLELEGYIGIVFQHEFDHINGIMFTTKLFDTIPNAKPAFEFIDEDEEDTL
ncbi:peptide deformylase [Mariniplasma anaerobium]|uniref:Peptide deformylase n=1 Tax=Mariniplasma anaerobium TaxID=2735436 RepID=A0A7U9TI70_9MOLU|nr:peptide deformylase [Mariniplasma anaerobium]BCR36559.1 peptide deformylase 2 [Mariniplasma anaerobium]